MKPGNMNRFMAAVIGVLFCAGLAHAEGGGITVMPDKSVIWQIVNFIVLIIVLNLVLYRPIRNVVARRQEKITGLDQSIQMFEQDAADKDNACTEGLKAARNNGVQEKNALIEEGTQEEKRIIEEIQQKTQKTIAENKADIARDAEKAAAELQQEIETFAATIGQKILGREVA
ncbi:MAG: ATP synthase F0 subunit B [Thermodesulfobacteriota bacterium]|nr:ATP synthase F0 subunit B [Thermodesulfobacteriota bacterium]